MNDLINIILTEQFEMVEKRQNSIEFQKDFEGKRLLNAETSQLYKKYNQLTYQQLAEIIVNSTAIINKMSSIQNCGWEVSELKAQLNNAVSYYQKNLPHEVHIQTGSELAKNIDVNFCIECDITIDNKVYGYSIQNFNQPLCRKCQVWFADVLNYSSATEQAIELYFALKNRGVPAILEKSDGYKTIDIAVPHAKVNIEIDGGHHHYDPKQALSDLKRLLYSFKKGYSTLHIPNSLAKYDLDQTADLITEFLVVSRSQKEKRDK
jgi:hypothetical protein